MRGTAARIAVGIFTIALAGGVTACGDDSGTSAATSSAPSSAAPATSAAAFPAVGHELVRCGTGPWGLAVVASTAKGNDFCPNASAVATAYADQRAGQSSGDIAVVVENVRWVCGERQGDPNPYQECASQNESADKVRLLS